MVDRVPRAVADLAQGAIVATVEIEAPVERVYRALTSEEITRWWGAEGMYRTTHWEGDVRPGGRFRAAGVGADGRTFEVTGEYVEAEPPNRLVHTWNPDWNPGKPTLVSYRLETIEGGTRLTLRHEGFTSRDSCASHSNGWIRVLGWLKAFAAPKPPSAFFLIRLLPPRPTFMVDMTDAERRIMAEHVQYWQGLLQAGTAHAFGPVADPKGSFGVGILEVQGGANEVRAIEANDPAVSSNSGFRYEILSMPQAVVRA